MKVVFATSGLFVLTAGVAVFALDQPRTASSRSTPATASRPSAAGTMLGIARSADGLKFTTGKEVFIHRAADPSLIRAKDGPLIAAFDLSAKNGGTVLCLSRSTDEGRTWSPAELPHWKKSDAVSFAPRNPCWLAMPDGSLRLFFIAAELNSVGRAAIRCATTTDGRKFRLDPSLRLAVPDHFDPHLLAVHFNNAIHLYAAGLREADDPRTPTTPAVAHFVCRDGRRWAELTPVQMPGMTVAGGTLPVRRYTRAYGEAREGVISVVTKDARKWVRDLGVRLPKARCPAVVALKDDSVLMLYGVDEADDDKTAALVPGLSSFDKTGNTIAAARTKAKGAADENVTSADATADDLAFPPKPDFQNKIDYLSWYRDVLLDQGGDNAYPYYAAFMKEPGDQPGAKPAWPELNDMFNAVGPFDIGPWDPAQHADWDASDRAAQPVLQMFREASMHESYASPVQFGDSALDVSADDQLLIGILLPQLSQHRALTKATLAGAWREEDGKVSPNKMLDAWQTSLGSARHLNGGTTLIEQLVGASETNLVEQNARVALSKGVFTTPDQMKQALEVLRSQDVPIADPARSLRGEYAMAMDTTQYLFAPTDAGGPPTPNPARIDKIAAMNITEDLSADAIRKMTPQDVSRTVNAFDEYYRELAAQMRVGYPAMRAADLEATQRKYVETSPMTHALLPVLSRVHQLRARSEASRRATQLSYAVHIYKAETGKWPATLSELPAAYGDTIRTDPFSGQFFGYRITASGPVIYSLSENGRDDGGAHSPKWGDGAKPGASDDYVFWPPAK